MKSKIVTSKDLFNKLENPTLCLSSFRVFDDCHKCSKYQDAVRKDRVDKLKCKPQLSETYLKQIKPLIAEKKSLIKKTRDIDIQIRKLGELE